MVRIISPLPAAEMQSINKRFAESVNSRLNMKYTSLNHFKEILQFSNTGFTDLMAGNLDWKTKVGFEKLDTILGNSPGYWESVYSNILNNYQTDLTNKSDFDGDVMKGPIVTKQGSERKVIIEIDFIYDDPRLTHPNFDIKNVIETLKLHTDIKLNAIENVELQKDLIDLFVKHLGTKLRSDD